MHRLIYAGDVGCVQNGPAAVVARRSRIASDMLPPRALPTAHFERNLLGRGQLAVFRRCSLGPYESRYGHFARALKNSQLTCGDVIVIYETAH